MTFAALALATLAATVAASSEAPTDSAAIVAAADRAGQRVELGGFDFDGLAELAPVIGDTDGPRLVLSDKPEYFRTGDGVALRETVDAGDVRLYLYHVPTPGAGPKQIAAVAKNSGNGPVSLTFTTAALHGPGGDYHAIGKAGQADLLAGNLDAGDLDVTLEPGESRLLDPRFAKIQSKTNDLLHGIYEFHTTGPVELSVLQAGVHDDAAKATESLPLLPQVLPGHHASGAGRGVFEQANKTVTIAEPYDTADGPRQIIFADGDNEPWMSGHDSIAAADPELGEANSLNKGHYGVVYHLTLPFESTDGRGVALLAFNPRAGGQWCGKQAVAVRLLSPGTLDTAENGIVELPDDAVRYDGPPAAVVIQKYEAGDDGTGTIELLYTPPGASCLPVAFVLMPVPADSQ